jgi:hypothetical protein
MSPAPSNSFWYYIKSIFEQILTIIKPIQINDEQNICKIIL